MKAIIVIVLAVAALCPSLAQAVPSNHGQCISEGRALHHEGKLFTGEATPKEVTNKLKGDCLDNDLRN